MASSDPCPRGCLCDECSRFPVLPKKPYDAGHSPATTSKDDVDHPSHYTSHPSGVECIQVTEHMNFNLGNAVKYIWRAGLKGKHKQDLQKAIFYLNRELERLYGDT